MADVSKVRQNFHKESEAGINKQINLGKSNSQHLPHFDLIHSLFFILLLTELYASYVYQQLVSQSVRVLCQVVRDCVRCRLQHTAKMTFNVPLLMMMLLRLLLSSFVVDKISSFCLAIFNLFWHIVWPFLLAF